MRPWFTSLNEWDEYAALGERDYVRLGVSWTVRAAAFGLSVLLAVTPTPPVSDFAPMALLLGGALGFGIALAKALFTREWRAAAQTFGVSNGAPQNQCLWE